MLCEASRFVCVLYDLWSYGATAKHRLVLQPVFCNRNQQYYIPGNHVLPVPTPSLNGHGTAARMSNKAINRSQPVAL